MPRAIYSWSRKVRLVKGLPRKRLIQAIHYHARHGDVSDRALGFYLLDLERRREFQPDSVSAVKYAVEALGRDHKEATALIRMAEALEELPELDRAFAESLISISKLREIVRVAVPETELDWLAFAREHNCRQVEAAVSGARRGEKPPEPGQLGTPRVKFRIQYDLPVEVNAVWQAALEKLLGELGKDARPLDAIKAMCEMVLATDPERRIPAGRKARKDPVYTVVYHIGPDGQTWHQGRDGESPVPIEAVLAVMDSVSPRSYPGAEVIEVPDLEPTGPDGVSAIRLGERGSVPPEARDPPTPAWMRDKVLAREGDCCAICGSRKGCRAHHVESRADGGKTVIRKLATVCGLHHSLIHAGLLVIIVDERGKVWAKNKEGRIVGRELPARDALVGAPEEFAFTEIEVAKSPTWAPSAEGRVPSRGETAVEPGLDESPEAAAPVEIEVAKSPTWDNPESQVLSPLRSPVSKMLMVASLDRLPAVLTAPEWRALESRLEWSANRGAFVLREDAGFDPEPAPREAPGRNEAGSPLRPAVLSDVIGQERAVEGLQVAVEAARLRDDALDHVLLTGEPGLGKTTLAGALAHEMGSRLHSAMGALITEPVHAIGLLTRLERRDVLFIDEIHRLPRPVTECLHSAMEDRVVHVLVAERGRIRSLRVELEPFTLAGATMEPGVLPDAFRARFGIRARLEPYAEEILARLVERGARALGLEASTGSSLAVARRSRGTPREALRLLERARDAAQAGGSAVIEASHVEESARRLEIDPDGLGAEERRILEVLIAGKRPMGLQALAAMTGIDPPTIRNVHEPYLLRRGYVVRTARGREATTEARFRMACGPVAATSRSSGDSIIIVHPNLALPPARG